MKPSFASLLARHRVARLILAGSLLSGATAQAQVAPRDPQGNVILIKDTNYPVPSSGAYFVAPTGNDANPGTQAQPWRTVAKAVNTAPDGSTLVLRAGVYPVPYTDAYRRLTYQPYPHEQVWLTGSEVVSGWVQDGNAWRRDNWTVSFPVEGPPTTAPERPLAGRHDQAFLNGRELVQVGSRAEVGPGTFYVDEAADRLYLGNNPAGQTVEATVATRGLGFFEGNPPTAPSSGSVLHGLGFCHYARQAMSMGGVRGLVLENNTFAANAFIGLEIYGERDYLTNSYAGQPGYATLRGNTFSYNGQQGLVIGRCHGLLFEGNTVTRNNTEGFSLGWGAAGMKAYAVQNMTVRNNLFADNFAHGLWFDVGANNCTVVSNVFRDNAGTGMWYEISKGGIFAGNLLLRNREDGLRVLNHDGLRVYNNTSVGDYTACHIYDSGRQPEPGDLELGANFVTRNVTVKNNVWVDATATDGGQALLDTWWYNWGEASGRQPMLAALDYNAYVRSGAAQPKNVARIVLPPNNLFFYQTLAQLQAGTSYEDHGRTLDNVNLNSVFANPAQGNYQLSSGSTLRGAGEALPADVAQALGVAAGVPVDLGAYPQSTTPPPVTLQDGQVYELAPQCAPGLRLDVQYAGSANGTRVWLHTANGSAAQRWRAVAAGNGQFELEPLCAPGQRLDAEDGGTAEGTLLQLWQDYSNPQQQWTAQAQGDGTVELLPRHAPDRRLDVQRAGTTDGTLVQLYADNNSAAQRWQLLPVAALAAAAPAPSQTSTLGAYPNPSPDGRATLRLTAQQTQRATVYVHNQQGRLVSLLTVPVREGQTEFHLPATLPTGTYFLDTKLDGKAQRFTLKVE